MDEPSVGALPFDVNDRREPQSAREPGPAQVPRLWRTFAAAWLLVLVITAGQLAREPLHGGRHAATLVDLALLAALYLWLTLRIAPPSEEGERPREIATAYRVAAVIGMSLLVVHLSSCCQVEACGGT